MRIPEPTVEKKYAVALGTVWVGIAEDGSYTLSKAPYLYDSFKRVEGIISETGGVVFHWTRTTEFVPSIGAREAIEREAVK